MFAIAAVHKIWHAEYLFTSQKLDNLQEVRRYRSIDIVAMVESRHDVESVPLRRLVVRGFSVTRICQQITASSCYVPFLEFSYNR